MDKSELLILSGTYVGVDLTAEFGRIPPSFLPLGTKRLIEAQLDFAKPRCGTVWLTLPDDYQLSSLDIAAFNLANVRIIRLPSNLPLHAAARAAIGLTGAKGRLSILFGDTLVEHDEDPDETNYFVVGSTKHFAKWAEFAIDEHGPIFIESLPKDGGPRDVVSGYFDIEDASSFCLALAEESTFFRALSRYARDRSFRPVRATAWLDFGHLHTYFQSRRSKLAARNFNRIVADSSLVRKSGFPPRKIYAESEWYRGLPARLKIFTPQLIDSTRSPEVAYEMEYLYLSPLSELYCFSQLDLQSWSIILRGCDDFLTLCQETKPLGYQVPPYLEQIFFVDMIEAKTFTRLEQFAHSASIDLASTWKLGDTPMPSLQCMAESLIASIRRTEASDLCLWHGDFHFANIFADFRAQRIRCVDPRGQLSDGTLSIYGDARYDIAKLSHSILGLYDFIVAGRFEFKRSEGYRVDINFHLPGIVTQIQREFTRSSIGSYKVDSPDIRAITILLFLSMLPLHDDDQVRQFALLANAFRLWTDLG